MNEIFKNEQNFSRKMVSFRKQTNNGRTQTIIERFFSNNISKKLSFFTEWTIFSKKFWKNIGFSEQTKFIERIILLNKRFYYTSVQWENERINWNMNDNFKSNNRNQCFWTNEKTNKMGRLQTMNNKSLPNSTSR